jgi:ElaB/YqjD/DUF883 family membrane-anchored ribosome-binding protein
METDYEAIEKGHSAVARERIMADLQTLTRDAEDLLKATAGDVSEKAREALRDHPYESIGVAFGVGLLIGVLVARR